MGPSQPAALLLQYAEPAAQLGITVHREPDEVIVIIPPPSVLRMVFAPSLFGTVLLGMLSYSIISTERKIPLLFVGLFIISAAYYVLTFGRRRAFKFGLREVGFGYVMGAKYWWLQTWPRSAIGEVKRNPYSGKLMIRVTGKDMQEYFISRNPDVTQYVVDALLEGSGTTVRS